MSTHPATHAVAQEVPQAQLATIEMASQPGGVRIVLLCPFNRPDCIVMVLFGSAEGVLPMPSDENPVLTAFGPAHLAAAPGSYGLAPCVCCGDNRWRIVLPIVHFDGWQDHLAALAIALGQHVLACMDSYCLKDLEALAKLA